MSMQVKAKWTAVLAGAATAAMLATAAARAADLNPQEKSLIEAAKKEGAVTIINPVFADRTAQRLGEAFIKRYDLGPNFKFNNLRKGTGQTASQVRQEIRAGKFTVDVHMLAAPGFFDEIVKRGGFLKLDSGYWKDSVDLIEKAGQYSNYPYVVVPLAYAFQPVWNSACPGMEKFNATSYDDMVKPELKGKTIATDITKSFTYSYTALAMEEAGALNLADLWKRIKATDPIVEFRTEPKMQMVISCQRPVDMWNTAGRVYQNVVKEPSLAKTIKMGVYKEGEVLLGNQMGVLKGAPHPNAGKLLVEFLLSKEGADITTEGEATYSFRKGYKPPAAAQPYLFDLNTTKLVGMKDWVGAQAKLKPMREAWQAVFR
jgi:iron(III) transport system substrate-binding protein